MDTPLSTPAIAIGLALLVSLVVIHIIGAKMVAANKQAYFITLIVLLTGFLFIPVVKGGNDVDSIPLWMGYHVVIAPSFFSTVSKAREIVLGIIFLHHFASITIAVFAAKVVFKRKGIA